MREQVAVNSRYAKVASLQCLQTWQIIVLIYEKRKRWKFKLLPLLRRNVELYLFLPTRRECESLFFCCRFLQMLSTAATIEVSCLSAVFFALLICWHVQISKIFPFFLFSSYINFYL